MDNSVITVSGYLLENGFDTVIPVVLKRRGEKTFAECYPGFEKNCSGYVSEYGCDPFSPANLEKLIKDISPVLTDRGYVFDFPEELGIYAEYVCTPNTVLKDIDSDVTTVRLYGGEYDESLLETPVNCSCGEDDGYSYTAFGVVRDGKVVSVCAENTHVLSDDETEIGVETASDYRNRGYGKSTVISLCRALIGSGRKKIIYETDISNTPSVKCAESCGLELEGENCYIIARKND